MDEFRRLAQLLRVHVPDRRVVRRARPPHGWPESAVGMSTGLATIEGVVGGGLVAGATHIAAALAVAVAGTTTGA